MFTLGTHFEELLKNLQPPQDRLDAAVELPPKVRAYLKEHADFVTVPPHTRLAGSYAQGMSVGDVKDVDFLVSVPGDPEANDPEAKRLIRDLKKTLDGLPEALGYEGFAAADITGARRSVHIYITDHDFHLDVVPCIAPDGFEAVLYVPDRGFNEWVASQPIGFVNLLNDLNNEHGKKVKPLGKLFKHFRNHQMKNRRPKSYWLGALLVHHVRREGGLDMSQPLAVLFRDLLDAIYFQYDHLLHVSESAAPNIPDPMLGHNVSWNWGRSAFETFMRRLDDGRRWATNALDSEDRETAIEWWQKIFGAVYFPADVEQRALGLATAAHPGRSFVTSSGLIVPAATKQGVYTPTRETTFHGTEE